MATEWAFHCRRCQKKTQAKTLLYDALLELSKSANNCQECGQAQELHLAFDFGLEAGRRECTVLDVFVPSEPPSWPKQDGKRVTFFPFLVAVEQCIDGNKSRAFWLPYWHIEQAADGARHTKYGQWAPFMDDDLLESLVQQARRKGYFK
jgi:hypothetical protein